jgi:hypothetical protein
LRGLGRASFGLRLTQLLFHRFDLGGRALFAFASASIIAWSRISTSGKHALLPSMLTTRHGNGFADDLPGLNGIEGVPSQLRAAETMASRVAMLSGRYSSRVDRASG